MKNTIIQSYLLIGVVFLSACCRPASNPRIVIETSLGAITAEIYLEQAPVSGGHFLQLVDQGLFNRGSASFYRITRSDNQPRNPVKIDVIQGGLRGDTTCRIDPIAHETTRQTGLTHRDGSLSMARADPGTASSEFFICIGAQPELDFGGRRNPDGQGFAVFGQVTDGMDLVVRIQSGAEQGQYLSEPVRILSIRRLP